MWTYLLGPFLALLPKHLRDASSFTRYAEPARAATLSGILESILAILALSKWYFYAMSTWISRGLDSAMAGRMGQVTDQEIASAALSVWLTHPSPGYLLFLLSKERSAFAAPLSPITSLALFHSICSIESS